jgi:DNA-3-methyladenine glycosylase II
MKITCQGDVDNDIQKLIAQDARLGVIVKAVLAEIEHIPLRLREPGFAGVAHTVIAQLLCVASAKAISQRFNACVQPLTAANYLSIDPQILLDCGLSNSKYQTLKSLAQAEKSGSLNYAVLTDLPIAQAIQQLCAYKGIGPWTAQVYLLFCAGHRDIFPEGDLALQKALDFTIGLNAVPGTQQAAKQAAQLALQWAPYRGAAARLFWAYFAHLKQTEVSL